MAGPAPGGWTALLPFKSSGDRKTRLQSRLDTPQRDALAERLFAHVTQILAAAPAISEIILISQQPVPGWRHRHIADAGRGLNAELAAVRSSLPATNLLVIHADLPLLAAADIAALLATSGIAIAPDRHGAGTNALALPADEKLPFAFGTDSFARHLAAAGTQANIVRRLGLALDIDTPDDLDTAIRYGFEI